MVLVSQGGLHIVSYSTHFMNRIIPAMSKALLQVEDGISLHV